MIYIEYGRLCLNHKKIHQHKQSNLQAQKSIKGSAILSISQLAQEGRSERINCSRWLCVLFNRTVGHLQQQQQMAVCSVYQDGRPSTAGCFWLYLMYS